MRNWIVLRTCAFNWNAYFSVCVLFCFAVAALCCCRFLIRSSFSKLKKKILLARAKHTHTHAARRNLWGERDNVSPINFKTLPRSRKKLKRETILFFFSSFCTLSRKKTCAPKDMIPNRHGHWDTLGTRWGKHINKNKNNRHTIRSKQRDERHEIKIYNIFLTHIFFFSYCCCSTSIFFSCFPST